MKRHHQPLHTSLPILRKMIPFVASAAFFTEICIPEFNTFGPSCCHLVFCNVHKGDLGQLLYLRERTFSSLCTFGRNKEKAWNSIQHLRPDRLLLQPSSPAPEIYVDDDVGSDPNSALAVRIEARE